jgi:DNA-binding response OmpR family regulator
VTIASRAIVAHILLVEDEVDERRIMRLTLERSGHVVAETEDAMAAIARCRNEATSIALVICDIGLPDQNGKDFINWFREVNPSVPVMVVTGESMAHIEEPIAAAWYGAHRVVSKLFSASDLTTAVAELLHDTKPGGGLTISR